MAKLKIGIVGCGAIGTSLAKFIAKSLARQAELAGFYDIDISKSRRLCRIVLVPQGLAASSLQSLINRSGLIIECASAGSSFAIARASLIKRRDVMIMSAAGAAGNLKKLRGLAVKYHARVYIPSGAISGVDALKAASCGVIRKVTLTTYKNPRSFKGVPYIEQRGIKLSAIKKDKVIFFGPAREAVRHFPQNINVAAVLGMAGIGQDKTMIKIVASPAITRNIHQVRVQSAAADITARTENILHPENPKTSYLAVLSAAACLKQILEPVRIGT